MWVAIVDALLCAVCALISIPILIFVTEIAAAVCGRYAARAPSGIRPSVTVLIPAHNEESGIGATLRSITSQLAPNDRLIVVADNCSDRTASVASAENAEVVSRTSAEKRGKGFALDFGLQHVGKDPSEVVIMVDADCQVAPDAIDRLARVCFTLGRPVQAEYLMKNKPDAALKMRVAEFTWKIKNLVRPAGLAKLGLPCQLMGSGMAFPWSIVSKIKLADGHIVEDMKLGLDLARLHLAPAFLENAKVTSFFPIQEEGIQTQRTRWEHGHLGTIFSEAPSMFWQGTTRRDFQLIAMAFDLCVPPLTLLMMESAIAWLLGLALYALTGVQSPLVLMTVTGFIFCLAIFVAWAAYGRGIIKLSDLLSASFYPLGKIPLYFRFVFSRQSEWVRSQRDKHD